MSEGALKGIRVLECGEMVAAAYAAKLLADMGAEVIKVEEPSGDPARRRGPYLGGTPHPERSGLFLFLNTNKYGVTLDLRKAEGRELFRRLVGEADLLIHNYPPSEMVPRGLDYQELREVNPRLIMTSISPFGQTGSKRDLRAHDLTLWSAGGLLYLSGLADHPDLPPVKAFGQQAGLQTGVNAANVSVGALFGRIRRGQGRHIDVSAQECLAAIMENNFVAWPYLRNVSSRLGFRLVPQDFIRCRDGYIYILAVESHQWASQKELMGNPEWAESELFQDFLSRSANWDALKPLLEDWAKDQSVAELYRQAQARRVPFAPVSTMGDLVSSEHLRARGFFAEIAHPVAGALRYPSGGYRFSETPWALRRPAPCLGQHNDEIFGARRGL